MAFEIFESAHNSKNYQAAIELAHFMSHLSRKCWEAGWMRDTEEDLWRMVQGDRFDFPWSMVTDSEIQILKELSETAGGWWHFDPSEGEVFVATKEWEDLRDRRIESDFIQYCDSLAHAVEIIEDSIEILSLDNAKTSLPRYIKGVRNQIKRTKTALEKLTTIKGDRPSLCSS